MKIIECPFFCIVGADLRACLISFNKWKGDTQVISTIAQQFIQIIFNDIFCFFN